MKIRRVTVNNRKAQLEVVVRAGKMYPMPYSRLDPRPTSKNRIHEAFVDEQLDHEAVTYVLESGAEGAVHIDHVLEYNQDPAILAELLAHRLTLQARRSLEGCGLSRREVARRIGSSLAQLYRLLDPANTAKSLGQLISLLYVVGCDVDLVVRPRRAA